MRRASCRLLKKASTFSAAYVSQSCRIVLTFVPFSVSSTRHRCPAYPAAAPGRVGRRELELGLGRETEAEEAAGEAPRQRGRGVCVGLALAFALAFAWRLRWRLQRGAASHRS